GNKIYNNSDEGIHIYNVDAYNNIISSNEVYENYDYNIYISNGASSNIVKDNNIHSSDSDGGIYVAHTTTTNNQIINNTVHDNIDEGIAIGIWSTLAGNNNSVINNTIFSNGLRGIFVNTDNTTVHGNNVYGNSNYGIYIYKVAGHVNVTNNYVYNGLNRGIESQESQNISVTNNYVFNNSLHGFFLYKTNNSLFRNNTLTDNFKSSYGGNVELFVFSFNIFEDNKIIGGSDFGLRTYINVNNNIIRNNLVANSSDDLLKFGDSSSGDCDNNTFINNTFESNGSFNFLATINYANNNEFIDNTFTGSGTHFYFGNDGNNTIFLNTTFDSLSWEVAGVHDVYVKWYLDIKVNTSDGDLENANVTLYNNTDVLEFSELTNASGWILRKNLTEYMYDGSTYTYYTNYTVNTTSPSESYGNNSREIDLTSSIVEYITLDSLNEAPIVSSAKITPTIAHTADNLAGYCNATDANLDNVTYYYEWYNDGILNNSGDSVLCASGHTNNGDGTCTVTLRPDSGGDLTEFPNVVPSGAHYLNVDESVADNDTTFVGSTVDVSGTPTLKVALKENSVISVSPNVDLFATYYIDSWTKTTRPSDSGQWTIADIDALQIGVNATTSLGASDVDLFNLPTSNIPANSIVNSVKIYERSRLNVRTTTNIRVTQVYVNVTYTPSIYYLPGVEINVNNLSNSLTTKGENWTFNCMAFDGIINASSWVNESIIIQNSLPEQVLLDLPENGNNTIDRTPGLSWNVPDDDDSDSLTYHLFVNDSAGGIIYNQTGVATNSYTFSSDLTLDDTYSWRVRANDSEGFGSWSSLWNFTVDSVVTISATTNSIAFGSLGPGVTSNTSTDSPPPFVLQNDGNSLINISVNASQLFDQAALGTDAYQFKVDNTTETGSFSWLTSIINWFNMPSGAVVAIDSLKYEDSTDSVEVDILATVPTDELAGSKSSTVYFEAAIAE
ncbi:hypothetical protein HOA69_01525, partial [Candidatus Woesearchaeota archaeon]|nr:hypothetical protein [Candidatus Woesearchaeota archaeon]